MNAGFFTTARITALLYLGLAITGILAFLYAKTQLFVEGDAIATSTNLATLEGLARIGIAAELALVTFQVLVALWFFKLFRKVNSFAAISLAVFGTINAVIILIAAAFWLSALTMASSISIPPTIAEANSILLLFNLHESLWVVGELFFGLWLIPMGYLVIKAKMPRLLGWTLIAGGVSYMLSLFLSILIPAIPSSVIQIITIPATIGEFWIIGYLLVKKTPNE